MSDYINRKGFTVTRINQSAAMEMPPREFFRSNDIYAYESLIPQTPREATRVYFVSGTNGDEFGQFSTEAEAREKAAFIANLTPEERIQHEG